MESFNRRLSRNMHDNSLKLLEERVLGAVQRIQELKTENEQLRSKRDELADQVAALQDKYDESRTELAEARQQAQSAVELEDKRRIIEEKVGGLLEKLDAIE